MHTSKRRWLIAVALLATMAVIYICITYFSADRCASAFAVNANKLRTIGLACMCFASEHEGQYPDDWAKLAPYLAHGSNDTRIFVSVENEAHAGAFSNVMEWTDFVYVRGARLSASSNTVIAFLPPGQQKDALVLHNDGHVQSLTSGELSRSINRTLNKKIQGTGDPSARLTIP